MWKQHRRRDFKLRALDAVPEGDERGGTEADHGALLQRLAEGAVACREAQEPVQPLVRVGLWLLM